MLHKTILVGGPRDGMEIESDFANHHTIKVPCICRPMMVEPDRLWTPEPSATLLYKMVYVGGKPSIDDEGRYRHSYEKRY